MIDDTIRSVVGWEALDSRGRPTVACRVELGGGAVGTATVPSGASAGRHEALELRDGGQRYAGRGVRNAVANVNGPLADSVRNQRVGDVDSILAKLDGTPRFTTFGANATLAVSLASAIAEAHSAGTTLARRLSGPGPLLIPMPMVNIISGGAHAAGALDVQDFLVLPHGAESFGQAIEWSVAVRDAATALAAKAGRDGAHLAADEGGLGVHLESNRAALDLITEAIEAAGLRPGTDAGIALDIAASEFLVDGRYEFRTESRGLDTGELIDELESWCDSYPILSIEDPLGEDDWDGWVEFTRRLSSRIQIVGDDLFVTQTARLARGIDSGSANAVLVKVNQNGLVSGAYDTLRLAQLSGYRTVVSARSGETEDSWLADLAVGWRAGQIKVGSTQRGERTAKWNRLLEFEATEETIFANQWQTQFPITTEGNTQ